MAASPRPLPESPMAAEVRRGLLRSPKSLPPKFFYDAAGSVLFEEITRLPEYYLTRTERAIFQRYAPAIVAAAGPELAIVELGAGSASKTCLLLHAALQRQARLAYFPVDVSAEALQSAAQRLRAQFPSLDVQPIVADFTNGFRLPPAFGARRLVLFIGSSIGNFEPEEASALLRRLHRHLHPGDALLLGADLAKDPALLLPAYNDSQGVTARFNLNMLARLNRELDADFRLNQFRHVAEWNPRASRMEIYLQSRRRQSVRLGELGLTVAFAAGERLHTENSYKYTPQLLEEILQPSGFTIEQSWHDAHHWFAVMLLRR
jgi:L-histidine N-alpha-methyltransferase